MGPTQGGRRKLQPLYPKRRLFQLRGRRGDKACFGVPGVRWLMSTGPCRALDSPRPPCGGKRGPRGPGSHLGAAGSAKPQAGSEPSLGRQRGRGEEPRAFSSRGAPCFVRCSGWFPVAAAAGAAGPGVGGARPAPAGGAWREEGGAAPRNKGPERGLGSEFLPSPAPLAAPPDFLWLPGWPPLPCKRAPLVPSLRPHGRVLRTSWTMLSAGRHTSPPGLLLALDTASYPRPCTPIPRRAPGPLGPFSHTCYHLH